MVGMGESGEDGYGLRWEGGHVQSGPVFGFPNAQSASPAGASGGGGAGAMGGPNLNLPPGGGGGAGGGMGGGGGGASSAGGSSAALVLGPPGVAGGLASGGSSAAASAAAQAQYMQAMMQQSQSFPFAQFPPHFGAATFNGPASHMGAQVREWGGLGCVALGVGDVGWRM